LQFILKKQWGEGTFPGLHLPNGGVQNKCYIFISYFQNSPTPAYSFPRHIVSFMTCNCQKNCLAGCIKSLIPGPQVWGRCLKCELCNFVHSSLQSMLASPLGQFILQCKVMNSYSVPGENQQVLLSIALQKIAMYTCPLVRFSRHKWNPQLFPKSH
jgi:hypothetical protein